jgi:hypothetical protein
MRSKLLLPIFVLTCLRVGSAATLTFESPGCLGATISGTVNLAAVAPGAQRVDFGMGSYSIGSAFAPSFSLSWNSNIAMDGVSAIQATARDGAGNLVASGECLVTIANLGVTLVVNSPDLTQTLSGTVAIALTGSDPAAFPAIWTLNIDGAQQQIIWTDNAWQNPNSVTFSLDTTQFSNGPHELDISMNSRTGPTNPQWVNWRGMVNQVVQFQNGHVLQEIIPQLQNVFVPPGSVVEVGCTRIYTDGQTGACSTPVFASASASVATVSGTGNVQGVAAGFTQVTLQDGTRTSTANVWVTSTPAVPHFAGNGQLLQSFHPGKSLFVISPFTLGPTAFTSPAVNAQLAQSGFNTLSFGVYINPWDVTASYSTWQANFNQQTGAEMQWAQANNYHLLLTGDDIFRRIGGDAWYTLNWPSGKQAVQYAVSSLASTGVGIGIEGIDEASMLWGPNPVPAGNIGASNLFTGVSCAAQNCTVNWPNNPIPAGYTFAMTGAPNTGLDNAAGTYFTVGSSTSTGFSFNAPQAPGGSYTVSNASGLQFLWFGGNWCTGNVACSPPVPNSAFTTFRSWITAGPTVPISFPSLATDPPQVDGNWMGPGSISDYASNYFTSMKTRTTYPWSEGIQEMVSSMEQTFFSRQPFFMLNRPQLMEVSLTGPQYTKGSASGATYNPGVDALISPGVSPQHVSAVMMDAAALGAAGERLYYFESPSDVAGRAAAPAGTSFQTGSNPQNLQTASWTAMSYAANLLANVLDPYLLGTRLNSPGYGLNIRSAARQGATGNLLLIVNGNDWQRSISVDLTPYKLGFGAAKYVVSATGINTSELSPTQLEDSVTLGEGESVVYILPSSAANMTLKSHQIKAPSKSPSGTTLQSSYLYPTMPPATPDPSIGMTPCAPSCTIYIDPNLGPFFYQFVSPAAAPTTVEEISGSKTIVVPPVY